MKQIVTAIILVLVVSAGFSQTTTTNYERFKVGQGSHNLCGLDLSPDGKFAAISSVQSFPLYIYDWQNRQIVKEFDVGNWHAGSSVDFSRNGNYLILEQLKYVDWAANKDKETTYEIINVETGKVVKRFNDHHAVKISADEKLALALTGDEVILWDLEVGDRAGSFFVEEAGNSVAISPDGNFIAVSHKLSKKAAKKHPRLKRDKKGRKLTQKYKRLISVFDAKSFEKLFTVDEFYDIIYKLEFSDDGKELFCLQIPHTKAQTGGGSQTFISVIDFENRKPTRKGFISRALYVPDFKLSKSGKLFGLVSQGNRFLEVHIYDYEKAEMIKRFQISYRFLEKDDEGEMISVDSRTSFGFTPDEKSVLITMGNRLILWDLELEN